MKIISVTVSKGRKIPGTGKDKYGNREYFVSATAELEINQDIPKNINELFKGCEQAISLEIGKDQYGKDLPPTESISDETQERWEREERNDDAFQDDDVLELLMLPKDEAMQVLKTAWNRARQDIQRDGTISYAAMWAVMYDDMKEPYFESVVFTLKELGVILEPRTAYYNWADPEDGK